METRKTTVKLAIYGGKNISKKTGEAIIYCEVVEFYTDGTKKTRKLPTIVSVKPKDFDKKTGLVLPTDEKYQYKNDIIDRKKRLTEYELTKGKDGLMLIGLNSEPPKTLVNYIEDYIEIRKAKNTPKGTLKEFITCKNRLIAYENHIGKKLHFDDIDFKFSEQWNVWLIKKYSSGTIHKSYSILRTVLNHYYNRRDEHKINLSDKFRSAEWKNGEPSKNEPNPLSEIQLATLYAHKFDSDALGKHRDRFLFQCSVGCRFSDAFAITPENIIGDCIEYFPVKTVHKKENRVIVPLNKISRSILEKYDYDMRKLAITNQKYNIGLKDLFDEMIRKYPKIFDRRYTSHNGRDTFITTCLNNDVDIPTLLLMSGQSSYDIMRRYVKIDRNKMIEKMNNVKIFS